ncbi:Armadillo-type fold [Amanita muscaria]
MSAEDQDQTRQITFQKLKAICVPLMGATLLTPATVPKVSTLVSDLLKTLKEIDLSADLTPSLISYVFLPVSTILRRNAPSAIPDQLLEKIFLVMALLCDTWWWTCEMSVWEQVFMLCGAVIGNIESKGKGKDRDEETKKAAAQCLLALLRERTAADASRHSFGAERPRTRKAELVEYAQTMKFIPILGQTLNSILLAIQSPFLEFQQLSLELTYLIVNDYAPDHLIPSILPGVVSSMTKVALGTSSHKGWANGAVVAGALKVMQSIVVKAIADSLCIRDGALSHAESLEALADLVGGKQQEVTQDIPSYGTARTSSWLRGISSQLHIAINTLSSLLSHPTPAAHIALCKFSSAVLEATPLSLPQTQALLLSFLLSLSASSLPSVSNEARKHLHTLFSQQSTVQATLMPTLMQITTDALKSLPHLISASSDAKVEHAAKLITAVAFLAPVGDSPGVQQVASGIGTVLGLAGGIEKWGWGLLSALELVEPMVTITDTSVSQLMLENTFAVDLPAFPALRFRNITSSSAAEALEKMFLALGRAAGERGLFSVEWFVEVGFSALSSGSVTALWCACRLLEGAAMISITDDPTTTSVAPRSKTIEKLARSLAKNIAEIWDELAPEDNGEARKPKDDYQGDSLISVERVQGIRPLSETLNIIRPQPIKPTRSLLQPILHRGLCLQLLAVTAGILQSQFPQLFIQTLYPVLHSLTSTESFLSSTALATLRYITIVTSYASPANLLLSNFDYALDSVSRRLTRRWLDVDATKVFLILIRLVGSDVVERAADVVDECFDRLDDYNEDPVIVGGLVEVLTEVITIIRSDNSKEPNVGDTRGQPTNEAWGAPAFLSWYNKRQEKQVDDTDYGPAPRTAWSSTKDAGDDSDDEQAPPQTEDAAESSTPVQALTKQIANRSIYFLTHGSPVIRARILMLLTSAAAVLPESALLPSIHAAWPYILNRLLDNEPFVIAAAALLIETLTTYAGEFMFRRIWDDVWPRFQKLLDKLNVADSKSALARRRDTDVGTASAYTVSHRLYRSIIKTMTATIRGVDLHEASVWHVTLAFRRFLSQHAQEELQSNARDLYLAIASKNADVVWLALSATTQNISPVVFFLLEEKWKIEANANKILSQMGTQTRLHQTCD